MISGWAGFVRACHWLLTKLTDNGRLCPCQPV